MKPKRRKMMRHVEFCVEDLKKLQPKFFGDDKRSGRRGPAQDVVKRSLVWRELLTMALEGQLTGPEKIFDGKTDLVEILHERLNPEGGSSGVGKNIVSEIVRAAYPRITA
jgi:hypothetical protein